MRELLWHSVGFMFRTAMNTYPCGFYGDPKRECRCTNNQIANYRHRISGPLLDRIDIHVDVPSVDFKDLLAKGDGETSDIIRKQVQSARAIQSERFAGVKDVNLNSGMTSAMMRKHCDID